MSGNSDVCDFRRSKWVLCIRGETEISIVVELTEIRSDPGNNNQIQFIWPPSTIWHFVFNHFPSFVRSSFGAKIKLVQQNFCWEISLSLSLSIPLHFTLTDCSVVNYVRGDSGAVTKGIENDWPPPFSFDQSNPGQLCGYWPNGHATFGLPLLNWLKIIFQQENKK